MGNEGWYEWNMQGINKNLYEILFWKREEIRSMYAECEGVRRIRESELQNIRYI